MFLFTFSLKKDSAASRSLTCRLCRDVCRSASFLLNKSHFSQHTLLKKTNKSVKSELHSLQLLHPDGQTKAAVLWGAQSVGQQRHLLAKTGNQLWNPGSVDFYTKFPHKAGNKVHLFLNESLWILRFALSFRQHERRLEETLTRKQKPREVRRVRRHQQKKVCRKQPKESVN